MLLPGRTAAIARQSAANVVVRYLGGDMSLVQEIMANRNIQAHLESHVPDHPATIFGESVTSTIQGPSPHEIEMAQNARIQTLSSGFQLAQSIHSTSLPKIRVEAQKAIDNILLPTGDATEQYIDAAGILRERAYTEEQINRLSGELGQDLKLVVESEGQSSQSSEQRFGPHRDKQVGLYHRVRDADLIEDVLSSFKQRLLYSRIMSDESESQNPSRSRRHELLNAEGRGRSRSARGIIRDRGMYTVL